MSITLAQKKILIIEDNADIANLLLNLRGNKMQVDIVTDGALGYNKALNGDYQHGRLG